MFLRLVRLAVFWILMFTVVYLILVIYYSEVSCPESPSYVIYSQPREGEKGKVGGVGAECEVNCVLSNLDYHIPTADALLFDPGFIAKLPVEKPKNQRWILSLLESPANTRSLQDFDGLVDFVATYWRSADIYTPYASWTKHNSSHKNSNAFSGKTKEVAWVASNCLTPNNRAGYARALSQYIKVDIFGKCGTGWKSSDDVFTMLKNDYKFYLAFENSNCQDYITEKFWWNALNNGAIPVVMGAPKEDYLRVAPPHSFIHVDDFNGPQALARYLNQLSNDEVEYNKYFAWRDSGKISPIKTPCQICRLLHNRNLSKVKSKLDDWWSTTECTKFNGSVWWQQ